MDVQVSHGGWLSMALTVTFSGKVPLATSGPNAYYQIWTYTVQASTPGELSQAQRIGLGLPADADVLDPRRFPDIPALAAAFLEDDAGISRQYVGKVLSSSSGTQTISFVAPAAQAERELFLVGAAAGRPWTVLPFAKTAGAQTSNFQTLPAPASGARVPNGRPVKDFIGTLPYASEVFGVYQPLIGWRGEQNRRRLLGADDVTRTRLYALVDEQPPIEAVLSPVGLVNLFRQYFFEFDTFLGAPAGHLWLSPGGTVELVESSTRRTLVERTAEQSEQSVRKSEESLTEQNDVADAVKEDNSNDTTLGASASAGGGFAGIVHGEASVSFGTHNTTSSSSERTHKHSRTQSSKVTSEITRNFKTTFKTVTEQTDTSSRRYLVQNTSTSLVNYELRRKMRKVGVQLQHLGSQLSWQVFLGPKQTAGGAIVGTAPGLQLGLGELVSVVPAPDLAALNKPVRPPARTTVTAQSTVHFPIQQHPSTEDAPHLDDAYQRVDDNRMLSQNPDHDTNFIVANFTFTPTSPGLGYTIRREPDNPGYQAVKKVSAKTGNGSEAAFTADFPVLDAKAGTFQIKANNLHSGGTGMITVTVSIDWDPPTSDPAQVEYERAKAEYDAAAAVVQRKAYAAAVRDRLALVSTTRPRQSEDLRKEERQAVFGQLIDKLDDVVPDKQLASEIIRQLFDVDQMLYFVAPDYWRPGRVPGPATSVSVGRYPVPSAVWEIDELPPARQADPMVGETVLSWYSHTSSQNPPGALDIDGNPQTPPPGQEWRVNYLITENTTPAPMGSSLGWLIQADGDERRNEFLNASWVKAVLPIRPGNEELAFQWLQLAEVEGVDGLDVPYRWQQGDPTDWQGLTIRAVLEKLATELKKANTTMANTLATEKVFETGFDPLDGGFRPAEPYQIFDQWVEVLPTDQIVAVPVTYDPKTGQQL